MDLRDASASKNIIKNIWSGHFWSSVCLKVPRLNNCSSIFWWELMIDQSCLSRVQCMSSFPGFSSTTDPDTMVTISRTWVVTIKMAMLTTVMMKMIQFLCQTLRGSRQSYNFTPTYSLLELYWSYLPIDGQFWRNAINFSTVKVYGLGDFSLWKAPHQKHKEFLEVCQQDCRQEHIRSNWQRTRVESYSKPKYSFLFADNSFLHINACLMALLTWSAMIIPSTFGTNLNISDMIYANTQNKMEPEPNQMEMEWYPCNVGLTALLENDTYG